LAFAPQSSHQRRTGYTPHYQYPEPTPVGQYYPEPTPVGQGYPVDQYYPEPTPVEQYYPEPTPVEQYGPEPTPVDQYYPEPTPVEQYYPEPTPVDQYGPEPTPVDQYYPEPTPVEQYGPEPTPVDQYGPVPSDDDHKKDDDDHKKDDDDHKKPKPSDDDDHKNPDYNIPDQNGPDYNIPDNNDYNEPTTLSDDDDHKYPKSKRSSDDSSVESRKVEIAINDHADIINAEIENNLQTDEANISLSKTSLRSNVISVEITVTLGSTSTEQTLTKICDTWRSALTGNSGLEFDDCIWTRSTKRQAGSVFTGTTTAHESYTSGSSHLMIPFLSGLVVVIGLLF